MCPRLRTHALVYLNFWCLIFVFVTNCNRGLNAQYHYYYVINRSLTAPYLVKSKPVWLRVVLNIEAKKVNADRKIIAKSANEHALIFDVFKPTSLCVPFKCNEDKLQKMCLIQVDYIRNKNKTNKNTQHFKTERFLTGQ